jgi:hypothetical protein
MGFNIRLTQLLYTPCNAANTFKDLISLSPAWPDKGGLVQASVVAAWVLYRLVELYFQQYWGLTVLVLQRCLMSTLRTRQAKRFLMALI